MPQDGAVWAQFMVAVVDLIALKGLALVNGHWLVILTLSKVGVLFVFKSLEGFGLSC